MGFGFDELQKENRRYKTDKKATDGRKKKVLGTGERATG